MFIFLKMKYPSLMMRRHHVFSYIGYGHVEFAYRLLDLVNKKIVKIRDVVFLEDKVIDIGN